MKIFASIRACSLLMPLLFSALAISGLSSVRDLHADPSAFVSVIPDLPLMAGLVEDPVDAVVFETSSGRIAQAQASGAGDRRAVLDFYAATLPQLGWDLETRGRYRREGEVLSLEITKDEAVSGRFFVHFRLAPAAP